MVNTRKPFLIPITLAIFLTGICAVFGYVVPLSSAENGLMENSQAVFFLLSFFIYAFLAVKIRRIEIKTMVMGLCWVSLHAFVREVDVEDFDLPYFVIWIGSGIGRNIILAIGWLSLIGMTLYLRKTFYRICLLWFREPAGKAFMCAAAFLILAQLFDRNVFDLVKAQTRLWEEILETAGAAVFFYAAYVFLKTRMDFRPAV